MTYTHKRTGWKRTAGGHHRVLITPSDGSESRVVAFMSAGSWANDPEDDRAKSGEDRVFLISGPPLPAWAVTWLDKVNARQCQQGRDRLAAMLRDADDWGGPLGDVHGDGW